MGRPRAQWPTPGARRVRDSWRISWRGGRKTYDIILGAVDEFAAESARLEVALALRTGEWPAWALGKPAVARYVGAGAVAGAADAGALLAAYEPEFRAEVGGGWASVALAALRELSAFVGGDLSNVSAAQAREYLAHVRETPGKGGAVGGRCAATRNRHLHACTRFYRWAVASGRVAGNPFAGVGVLREDDIDEIVHMSYTEKAAVLATPGTGTREGLAVWVGLYAGLRRGEIARLRWQDIALDTRKIAVLPGKTGKRRAVDMAAPLKKRLASVPVAARVGRVVPWPGGVEAWRWRARLLVDRIRAECPDVPADRVNWNPFRHTFASHLVQAGVSLFKVAYWLGDSEATARRHYASMSPHHDADIDRAK